MGAQQKKGCQPIVSTRSWRVSRRFEVVSGVPGTVCSSHFPFQITYC